MIKKLIHFAFAGYLGACCLSCSENKNKWTRNVLKTVDFQLQLMTENCRDSVSFPRSVRNGKLRSVDMYDWTSGFFAGNLWYAYELTGNKYFEKEAGKYTNLLYGLKNYKGTHDIGFMMYCSYGNAYRITKNDSIPSILVSAANSLLSRYNDTTKTIRSWDFGNWKYPVIIDNMMNLELLFFAGKYTGNPKYKEIAMTHAETTMKNHFRDDYSSYHVVSYDPATGDVESNGTYQGYADESAWARGQSWGLYGYTVCYRETQKVDYLEMAKKIAALIMNNPAIPEDKIPYWDYNAPNIPDAPRDASAAAVTASALLELSVLVKDGSSYFDYAEAILRSLSSPDYLSKEGDTQGFILMHSVGHLPANSEVDTPLVYADYYYLEALKRYFDIVRN
jgi:rhamnogalacturonyl hydrolase YesR